MSEDRQEYDIAEVELTINQAKELMGRKNCMDRLIKNDDFKKIILEDYFEKEPSRLVLLKADPAMQNEKDQIAINKNIDAIGFFRQYLMTIIQLGRRAEEDIREAEMVKEEMLRENLDN